MRIICTDNESKGIENYGMVARLDGKNKPIKAWVVEINNKKVKKVMEIPVRVIQSFYAHSNGMEDCNIPCPEYIQRAIESK